MPAPAKRTPPVAASEELPLPGAAAEPAPEAPSVEPAQEPTTDPAAPEVAPVPLRYVATVRHFVGGERGHIEPGEPIEPGDDLAMMLEQKTIREAP